ncbi:hypothetical protein [Methylobacterium nigriterrae]|uniref:hypothetical protein n=1 Tax=Methylobacterium nigriterrae TaxID=3127512 RepID=UPI003013DAD9
MVSKPTLARLARLERQRAAGPSGNGDLRGLRKLLFVLVAYYLGAMQPDETLRAALTRAFGYDPGQAGGHETNSGFDLLRRPGITERFSSAVGRLVALRGMSFDDKGNGVAYTLRQLCQEMPEWCRKHPALDGGRPEHLFEETGDELAARTDATITYPSTQLGPNRDPTEAVVYHIFQALLGPWEELPGDDKARLKLSPSSRSARKQRTGSR